MSCKTNPNPASAQPSVGRLVQLLAEHVRYWQELGEREIRRLHTATKPRESKTGGPTVDPLGSQQPTAVPPMAAPLPLAVSELSSARSLEDIRRVIGDCQRCKLCNSRTQIVFGVGNPNARLMFVGEGPGRDEDLQGEPFVGRAGQLLTEIITKGMRMRREDVYIANVVKCRPPDNRTPEPDEIARCLPFLARQIELVRPKVLVALGKVAAQALLETNTPISRLRGQWHRYRGIPLMPTLHPAYLLRNPAEKRLVWEDIKQVIRALES